MVIDTNSVLLIAGICMVIGFLIGGMVSSLRKKTEPDRTDAHKKLLLKAWFGVQDKNLIIEMDGVDYEHSANLTTRQRSQLNQIIQKMNDWLSYAPAQKQEDLPPVKAAPEPVASEKPRPRLSLNPVNVLTNALRADVSLSKLPAESIVSQIDDILQEKLRNSPPGGEAIRLMEWPNKGMVVMVGLAQYDSVDEVPDEEIKKLIRAAVSEWEQRGLEDPG